MKQGIRITTSPINHLQPQEIKTYVVQNTDEETHESSRKYVNFHIFGLCAAIFIFLALFSFLFYKAKDYKNKQFHAIDCPKYKK